MNDSKFEQCVRLGGKVKTQRMSKNRYQRTCQLGIDIYYSKVREKGKDKK